MQIIITKINLFIIVVIFFFNPAKAQDDNSTSESKPIVLLHGLFQNAQSWGHWAEYYRELGYTVYTPVFPYHKGDPAFLNQHIDPHLVNLEFQEVLDSITAFIESLTEKPIIIGHSIGGLLTQKLVEAGKVKMGITLASANPRGVNVLDWKYIRSNFRMVSPFRRRDKVCTPPLRWFRYTFFNTLNDTTAKAEHRKYFIPESRKIAKSSTKKGLEIDFNKPHVPMLFISGQKDNDLPPRLIYKNYKAYQDPTSRRDYYEFPAKSHYIVSEPGWEKVAGYVANWILQNE